VRLLERVLRIVLVLAAVAAVPSLIAAWVDQRADVIVVDLLALVAIITVTFGRRLPYRVRAVGLLATAFGLGAFLLIAIGPVGQLYLLAMPVLAALLLGLRPAVLALIATALLLVALGTLGVLDDSGNIAGFPGLVDWVMIAVNLVFIGGVLSVSCALLLDRLDRSLQESHSLAASLESERAVLEARNRALERESSQRSRAEEQLRFHSLLLDAVGEAVVATDLSDVIRYANPAAARLHGWQDGIPVGRRSRELGLYGVGEEQLAAIDACLYEGRTWSGEVAVPRPDGSTVPAMLTTGPYRTPDGQLAGLIAVATDVSELKATIDQLARSEEVRLAFLRATSHELRTPLASIVGFAEILHRYADRLSDERQAELLTRIQSNAQSLAALIEDLLDVDRLASGLVEADRQPTRIDRLVHRVVDAAGIQGRPLQLELEPVTAAVDVAKFERVVANLLNNAVRHTPQGTAITVGLRRNGAGCVLQFDDDGPGIEPSYLDRIFEPFVQGPELRNAAQPGTGIGLALVQELVGLHGGTVRASNRDGGGARFEVVLPDR